MPTATPPRAKHVHLDLPEDAGPALRAVAAILRRQLTQRVGPRVLSPGHQTFTISLRTLPSLPPQSYRIEDAAPGAVRILGADELGVLFGVGKLLRSSRFDLASFTPGTFRGSSAPKCSLRAVYLATHFNNYYEAAPIDDVIHYIQDLGLWGYNALLIHYPLWQFDGITDPAARTWLDRFKIICLETKRCGMRVGLTQTANGCYRNTPAEFRRTDVPGNLRGNFGENLCPSKPLARAHLLNLYDELLDQFQSVGLDYFGLGPYDEGGCACPQCWPWGARGYLSISREIVDHVRVRFPSCRIILFTWGFENENDLNPDGEWVGLAAALRQDKSWVDFIMADGHDDYFPKYLLDHGVPGGLPLVNFPEISMFRMHPWGGFGANPGPAHFQFLWDRIKHLDDGGSPYSEGIYEDINKAVVAAFYWDPDRKAMDTVKEYLAAEFTPDAVDDLSRVVQIFEENHRRDNIRQSALRAFEIVQSVEKQLTPHARQSWRWRIFFLRALIDRELYLNGVKYEGPTLKLAFDELTRIYHAQNVISAPLQPPQLE